MRFFINISHELRTPLTLILAPLQEVISKINDRWTRNQLEYIQRNANRLLHLVNQLDGLPPCGTRSVRTESEER